MLTPRGTLVIPQKYLPFLGAGAAAVATLAYILWGPDTDRRARAGTSKQRKVAGLENLGNTCYLNTILQSLAACPAFVKWLSRALRQGFFKGKLNELAYKLSKTLEVVNDHSISHGDSQVYSPHEVLHALYGCSWRADRGQQDAHELFQFLLSVLGEEKEPEASPVTLCDASRLIEPGRNGLTALHPDLHSNIEASLPKVASRDGGSPFRGLLANHLSCTVCGHRNPVTYSSFDCLTLPIPDTAFGALSLESILAKFTQRELVHDVECTECAKALGGVATPPLRRDTGQTAPPPTRGPVPPTPKHAPSASAVAPPPVPVSPPPSGKDPPTLEVATPTSRIAPPASQIASPSTLSPPTGVPLAVDCLPTSTAPPTYGQATPSSHDLQKRTPPPEHLFVDPPTVDLVQESVHRSVDVPHEGTDDSVSDSLSNCHQGNCAMDASPPTVGPREHKLGGVPTELGAETCNGALDWNGAENSHSLSEDLTQMSARPGDPSKAPSLGHEEAEDCEEHPRGNGQWRDSVADATLPSAGPAAGDVSGGSRVGRPTSPAALPDEGWTNGNRTKRESHPQSNGGDPQLEPADNCSLTAHQDLISAGAAQPERPSAPKPPRPSPLQRVSPPTNQMETSECTPTLSIFGRIPGTDGMVSPLPESLDRAGDASPDEAPLPKCRRIFRKQLTLGKLPQCLCVHLQRVTWIANGLPSRREEHVIFPEYLDLSPYRQTASVDGGNPHQTGSRLSRLMSDISDDGATPWDTPIMRRKSSPGFIGGNFLLDSVGMSLVGGGLGQMSPRVAHSPPGSAEADVSGGARGVSPSGEGVGLSEKSSKATEARYRLASAVVHQGDAYSGHFLTFRRAPSAGSEPLSDRWLCVSDESVYTSTAKEVFSQKAYMLYYQRA